MSSVVPEAAVVAAPLNKSAAAPVVIQRSPSTVHRDRSAEQVFYNSAKAPRSCVGKIHYCCACPGWNKATDVRVVYSRWEWWAPCGPNNTKEEGRSASGGAAAAPASLFQSSSSSSSSSCCCLFACCLPSLAKCVVPCGRQLDTFDADILVDLAAHQSCLQIFRGEGDIVMWRLAGGDLSAENEETFTMTDVPSVYGKTPFLEFSCRLSFLAYVCQRSV